MTKLHLGETDVPYSGQSKETTGDVGGWLEKKYGLYSAFWRAHGNDAAKALETSMAGALENLMMGAPVTSNPLAGGESAIEAAFREFLSSREVERMGIPGVPTKAALEGRSVRFKDKRGPRRPSFVDSGLLSASFKAWFGE